MAPKRSGSATILVGLERVPVSVFPATREAPRISFTTLCEKHGMKVEQLSRCPKDGKLFERPEKHGEKTPGLVSGYELGKGVFLSLTDEERDQIQPSPDPEIRIEEAMELEDVDPFLFNGTFQILAPDAGDGPVVDIVAIQRHAALVEALHDASEGGGLIAIGRWATRGTDRLVGLFAWKRRLVAAGLRRAGELRDLEEIVAAEIASPSDLEVVTPILARLKGEVTPGWTGAFPDEKYDATVKLLTEKAAERAKAMQERPKKSTGEARKVPRRAAR